MGTLLAAKKRKIVFFKGKMLLKGAHDSVEIKLYARSVPEEGEVGALDKKEGSVVVAEAAGGGAGT